VSLASALILLAAMSVSATFLLIVVALVWWIDRYDREPIHLVVMVFLWGASAAPLAAVMSFPLLEPMYRQLSLSESTAWLSIGFFTPLIEELAKGVGVLLVVVFSSKFDNPTDGVVYGTAVGLGFAVTENVMYGISSASHMSNFGGVLVLVGGRTLLSAGVHALSSATLGGFLGHAVLSGKWGGKLTWALTGLISAIVLHGSWNVGLVMWGPVGEDGTPRLWLTSLPFLYLVYVVVLGFFLHSEHRILKRQLNDEVALGLVPSWVVEVIPFYRRRVRSNWWPSRNERTVIARLLTRMAFRKQALENMSPGEAAIASLEVVKLRQRLREILDPEEPEAT
jgi:RsiW-degrading membrane proteinase PrsW (M82 family)